MTKLIWPEFISMYIKLFDHLVIRSVDAKNT